MAHLYRGIPYLPQSTQPRTFSAFNFQPRSLLRDGCEPQGPRSLHGTLDCACRGRSGYHDTRRHRTGRNVVHDHVVPKLQPGWTIYGALLIVYLLLLPLEAELSVSKVVLPFTRQQACISYLRKKLSSIRHYLVQVLLFVKFKVL